MCMETYHVSFDEVLSVFSLRSSYPDAYCRRVDVCTERRAAQRAFPNSERYIFREGRCIVYVIEQPQEMLSATMRCVMRVG